VVEQTGEWVAARQVAQAVRLALRQQQPDRGARQSSAGKNGRHLARRNEGARLFLAFTAGFPDEVREAGVRRQTGHGRSPSWPR
jgi:hypothetical protein